MIEERGLGGIVELGGDVRQRIGVLGADCTRRQRICERRGVVEHFRTTVLATSLGGRHTLAAGVHVGCRCAGARCVQRVDLRGQAGLEGVEPSPQLAHTAGGDDGAGDIQRGDLTRHQASQRLGWVG